MNNKVDVIMPMLGGGTRMKNMQNTCKPLYKLPNGEILFLKALESLKNYDVDNLILVIREEFFWDFKALVPEVQKRVPNAEITLYSHKPTKNQVESFVLGLDALEESKVPHPIISLDCDITGELPNEKQPMDTVASVFGFKHDNPNKSFIQYEGNKVTKIVEKQAISDMAVFGAYKFNDLTLLRNLLKTNLDRFEYMSQIYSDIIDYNLGLVTWQEVKNVKNYGTKEEWEETLELTQAKQYKAYLFDFDGTLFDTKKLNFKAYQLAYFDLGVAIDEKMFEKTDGLSVYDFNKAMGVECDVEKLRELKKNYYKDFVQYAEPNKYLHNLIKTTRIKTALVTTARKTNIDSLLNGYELKFDVMVTQEDVSKHKPAPDGYLKAIEELGVKPEECLAFEDSRPGFVAARQAGCDCVMVKEFQDDCVRNMSGGSDATTKLLVINGRLIVRKEAFGQKQAERLENQCNKLVQEAQNEDYVNIIDKDKDKDWFMYDMDYIQAPSLYEYINKIRLLPKLMEKLKAHSQVGEVKKNTEDIRKFCYETYIRPGMDIYEKVTGKALDPIYTNWRWIPWYVNNFMITSYHGDSTLENVLVKRNGDLLLIDPVPDGNAVQGLVHDYSKIAQSLTGYEAIRDGKDFDYTIECKIYDKLAKENLTKAEYQSLKFHTACLLFRRLKHQVEQDPSLVEVYGNIAWKLLADFAQSKYNWD